MKLGELHIPVIREDQPDARVQAQAPRTGGPVIADGIAFAGAHTVTVFPPRNLDVKLRLVSRRRPARTVPPQHHVGSTKTATAAGPGVGLNPIV